MEKKKASKTGGQKSPVSKVWLCKFLPSLRYTNARQGKARGPLDTNAYAGVRTGLYEGIRSICMSLVEGQTANGFFNFADMLLFVVCGGLVFELLRLVFGFFA